jgi:hypothetical protein
VTPERQVLYALVGAAFLAVVAVLIGGAATVGLVPIWWTILTTGAWLLVALVVAVDWRNTRRVLVLTIVLFAGWTVGTALMFA